MTIFLDAPRHRPGGPDGQGWNRLSLNAHMGTPSGQCALRPTSYATLHESRRDSRLAEWGSYGRCGRGAGACDACPLLRREPRKFDAFTDRVLVRLEKRPAMPGGLFGDQGVPDRPWVMNRPEDGWGSRGEPWTWEELAALQGWRVGRQYRDEHGEGFWLEREQMTEGGT
jgi:hypothetical protein